MGKKSRMNRTHHRSKHLLAMRFNPAASLRTQLSLIVPAVVYGQERANAKGVGHG